MVILQGMRQPIYVRPLSEAERETLEVGLRSSDAFTLRRCQILLASDRGENAYQIARSLGCNPQTVRNALSISSTRKVSKLRCERVPSAHIPSTGRSMRSELKSCEGCFIRAPGSSSARTREPMDIGSGCRGQLRGRSYPGASFWRDRPSHPEEAGGALGASQAMDHESRSPIREKKGVVTD